MPIIRMSTISWTAISLDGNQNGNKITANF